MTAGSWASSRPRASEAAPFQSFPLHPRQRAATRLALFVLAGLLAAPTPLWARGRRPDRHKPRPEAPGAPGPEREAVSPGQRSVIWAPPTAADALAAAPVFESRPGLRVTAILPPGFFSNDEASLKARQVFRDMMAQGRMETVMVLAGKPPLALIYDTDAAKRPGAKRGILPPRFSWPDDVLGHLAQGRALYRRLWQKDPPGLALGAAAVAGPEMVLVEKMKLRWVLLPPAQEGAGFFSGLPVGLVQPVPFPEEPARDVRDWIKAWALLPDPPPVHVSSLAGLEAIEESAGEPGLALVSEVWESRDQWPVWPNLDRSPDFSPWIGEGEENQAWRALGATRQALEDYKNSGRADIKKLDLALQEIYNAESGRYFYYFGQDFDSGRDGDLEQEFFATLAQVHRLIGRPVPAFLLHGFSASAGFDTGAPGGETFFEKTPGRWRWTDPAQDDRGPGDYEYPAGENFPAGSWDLAAFEVRVDEERVSFLIEIGVLPNPWHGPQGFSLPLVDVYVDINRLPGAGSQAFLPGRPGLAEATNAWEYALTVSGWGARLEQFSPGGAPRLLGALPVARPRGSKTLRVDVPRRLLRGDPEQWSYSVLVMGMDAQSASGSRFLPLPVAPAPGPRQFGGASPDSGVMAPPYLDILAPPGSAQAEALGAYKQGQDVVIPFVRGEP
jgi:hypothetical protein